MARWIEFGLFIWFLASLAVAPLFGRLLRRAGQSLGAPDPVTPDRRSAMPAERRG
jgi:hypothetical protein